MFKLVVIFLFYIIDVNESLISVGKYPGYVGIGVNLPECGLNRMSKIDTISFDKNCFHYNHPNRTLSIFVDTFIRKIDTPSSRVWKGTQVLNGEAPWVVYLGTGYWVNYLCTGALITLEWVVTAAHCLKEVSSITVYSGDIEAKQGEWRKVNKMFSHENYVPGTWKDKVYDIALLKLESKFPHKTDGGVYRINPICLPGANQTIQGEWDLDNPQVTKGENATFYGFGEIESGSNANKLRKGKVNVYSCSNDQQFCAEYHGGRADQRPCNGDSGGPLVQLVDKQKAVILGVLHSSALSTGGSFSCEEATSSLWTAVPKYVNWILKTMVNN